MSKPVRVNERIRAREVLLVDEDGRQVGTMPPRQALALARERGLDLVEVAPLAAPPVCRLLDWGRARYEQTRRERAARRGTRALAVKEVRLKPQIGDHDLATKARQARAFLLDGARVQLTVQLRGRQNLHPELGHRLLAQFLDQLLAVATVERPPYPDGRRIVALLAPRDGTAGRGNGGDANARVAAAAS